MYSEFQKRGRVVPVVARVAPALLLLGAVAGCQCKKCKTETVSYESQRTACPPGTTVRTEVISPSPATVTSQPSHLRTETEPYVQETYSRTEARSLHTTGFAEPLDLNEAIQAWPDASRKAAKEMKSKYGRPDSVTQNRIVWRGAGPWKEIIVLRDGTPHQFPTSHTDVLVQSIEYRVPSAKFMELAEFDGRVVIDRNQGTLTVRCDREAMNLLALNLAHDIINGNRSVEEADDMYAELARDLMAGVENDYSRELQFEPGDVEFDSDRTGNP